MPGTEWRRVILYLSSQSQKHVVKISLCMSLRIEDYRPKFITPNNPVSSEIQNPYQIFKTPSSGRGRIPRS
jgi:hypothetical protein